MKVRKSEVLFEEARKDLEVGCYNKAVSAAYFSVRLMAEALIGDIRTTKDDKIANALGRLLGRDARERMMWLFGERKRADHRVHLFDESTATQVLEVARELLERMKGRIRDL
ncbi:MAG: HEPN domain-containing protein [Candidatus Korarchaeota archaeon NZ13-K]|nr:MAG: HEPN domain-containing protein [Candidatus Korarchaeota archaeon NZ13-K]